MLAQSKYAPYSLLIIVTASMQWVKTINRPGRVYLLCSLSLISVMAYLMSQGQWQGDFWEHAAVLNEWSKHLWQPNNPIIGGPTPHAFFSPYAFVLAFITWFGNLDIIVVLFGAGVFNCCFYCYSIAHLSKSLRPNRAYFLALILLLFILFFYGQAPWVWSGFYHFNALVFVLPYPSTFSMALSVLSISLAHRSLQQFDIKNTLWLGICTAIVALTHPTTGVFLFIALGLLFLVHLNRSEILAKQFLGLGLGLLLICLWPYYPFLELIGGDTSDFHNDSHVLYQNLTARYWPLALSLIGLFFLRDKTMRHLLLLLFALLGIFSLAKVFGMFGFSRLISTAQLVSHIATAYGLVLLFDRYKKYRFIIFAGIGMACAVGVFFNTASFKETYLMPSMKRDYNSFYSLNSVVDEYDIIISDNNTSWMLPAFAGKVISSMHPLYWIPDIKARREALASFYEPNQTATLLLQKAHKYGVKFVLINENDKGPESLQKFVQTHTASVLKTKDFNLYKINYE